MKAYDIITAMDICVDLSIHLGEMVPEFGQKETLVENFFLELGGSAVIFGSQAAKLGLKVLGIGRVSDDYLGDFVMSKIVKTGILMETIKKDSSIKTGLGVALCKKDDRSILTYVGSINAVKPEDFAFELVEQTRHIHIGAYYLIDHLQPHYKQLLKFAKTKAVTVSLDTNWDPAQKWDSGVLEILPYVDVFLPNENELKAITRQPDFDEALKVINDIVPLVVVKRGRNGAVAYNKDKVFVVDAMEVDVADDIGAGDNFDAGFIYGYLNNFDLQTCLQGAVICGSMSVTKPGGFEGQTPLIELQTKLQNMQAEEKILTERTIND